MPQRFLKPGIVTSKKWEACSWFAQSFYIRILTLVDDFGRYDADPVLLKSHAFPLREDIRTAQVEELCSELQTQSLALFYESNGKRYLQLTNWTERARSDKSRFPEPNPAESCGPLRNPAESCGILPPSFLVPRSSSSPPPSPEERERQPEIPPMNRKDYDAMAEMRGVPKECAEWFWNTCDGRNWLDKFGQPIRKVEPLLLNALATWRSNQAKDGTKGQTGGSSASERILQQKELDRIEDAIKRLRDSYESHQDMSPADRTELKRLRGIQAELKQKLGFRA